MITLNVTLKHFPWPLVWIFEMVITLKSKKRWEKVAECLEMNVLGASPPGWVSGPWDSRACARGSRRRLLCPLEIVLLSLTAYISEHETIRIVHLRAHRCMHVYKWVYEVGGIPDAAQNCRCCDWARFWDMHWFPGSAPVMRVRWY